MSIIFEFSIVQFFVLKTKKSPVLNYDLLFLAPSLAMDSFIQLNSLVTAYLIPSSFSASLMLMAVRDKITASKSIEAEIQRNKVNIPKIICKMQTCKSRCGMEERLHRSNLKIKSVCTCMFSTSGCAIVCCASISNSFPICFFFGSYWLQAEMQTANHHFIWC